MPLPTVGTTRAPSNRNSQAEVRALVKVLAGRKQVIVAGAGANTDIAVAGISTSDVLFSVIEVPASAALVDRTSVASITSAGNIQLTQATTGNQLIVEYFDVDAA